VIALEPPEGGPWHLATERRPLISLCGVAVHGCTQRDPHKLDHYYSAQPCPACWSEWRLRTAASFARQDQHEALEGR